jgi:kinetochore protein Spc7/SPC105
VDAKQANPQATTRIRSEITDCQSELTYNEKSYDQFNPLVITEYLTSPENDRIQFEDYFRNLRIHTDLKAREEWYDWKMGMMDRVRPDVEEVLNEVLQVSY